MKKIYTCPDCGFAFAGEDETRPDTCPSCGTPSSRYLEEPWCGDISKRKNKVIPRCDPNRDPYDAFYHMPKDFTPQQGHGRARRFVVAYDRGKADETRKYYTDAFGWDIINVEGTDPQNPIMYCATGPGTADWEPRAASFIYGFLIPRDPNNPVPATSFVVEVKNIEKTCEKVIALGGKVLRPRYHFVDGDYAIIEDTEGNGLYIWEVEAIPDYCIDTAEKTRESIAQTASGKQNAEQGEATYPNPNRPPKKYPQKNLHGRVRWFSIFYTQFRRFQKFYIDVFGWDMHCGKLGNEENPKGAGIATGPSQSDWEGLTPGHMLLAGTRTDEFGKKMVPLMEMNSDQSEDPSDTLREIASHGGRILFDNSKEPGIQPWDRYFLIADPSGNPWSLWKCSPSRSWTEPECMTDSED